MLGGDGYLSQSFDLALVSISKDDRILAILVFHVGGEHFFFSPVMWFVHPLSIIQLEPPDA
jgi:hypothetical protein